MHQDFLMKKLKRVLIAAILIPFLFNGTAVAQTPISSPEPIQEMTIEIRELDYRAQILRDYLSKFNSPLAQHAQDFIEAADTHNLDWKLVPAIAGVESTFGKHTPGNALYPSYNGWGWGVYGTQAIYFKSWREGIFTVSEGLRKNYFNKGLTTPTTINPVYAASKSWGRNVDFFMNEMEKFADSYESSAPSTKKELEPLIEFDGDVAGKSAKLASK